LFALVVVSLGCNQRPPDLSTWTLADFATHVQKDLPVYVTSDRADGRLDAACYLCRERRPWLDCISLPQPPHSHGPWRGVVYVRRPVKSDTLQEPAAVAQVGPFHLYGDKELVEAIRDTFVRK
jgi:hypothetical protein